MTFHELIFSYVFGVFSYSREKEEDMIHTAEMTSRSIQEMVLVLSITFLVPWIGGIVGGVAKRVSRSRLRLITGK